MSGAGAGIASRVGLGGGDGFGAFVYGSDVGIGNGDGPSAARTDHGGVAGGQGDAAAEGQGDGGTGFAGAGDGEAGCGFAVVDDVIDGYVVDRRGGRYTGVHRDGACGAGAGVTGQVGLGSGDGLAALAHGGDVGIGHGDGPGASTADHGGVAVGQRDAAAEGQSDGGTDFAGAGDGEAGCGFRVVDHVVARHYVDRRRVSHCVNRYPECRRVAAAVASQIGDFGCYVERAVAFIGDRGRVYQYRRGLGCDVICRQGVIDSLVVPGDGHCVTRHRIGTGQINRYLCAIRCFNGVDSVSCIFCNAGNGWGARRCRVYDDV